MSEEGHFQFLFPDDDHPDLEWDDSTNEWILRDPIPFGWKGRTYEVPAGFRTDLASIPRFFQRVLPVNDKHVYPSIVHDYGYENGWPEIDRKEVDQMFLEAMAARGVPLWKRKIMWAAVRLFGRGKWG